MRVDHFNERKKPLPPPFFLCRKNQLQNNVANRIRDLTGNELVMLNDPLYMKNLCQRLNEKHQVREINFVGLAIESIGCLGRTGSKF